MAERGDSYTTAGLPNFQENDFTIDNFKFDNGQTLPRLKIYYRTFGQLKRDAKASPPMQSCSYIQLRLAVLNS
jgi:homoserine acetyltransferase